MHNIATIYRFNTPFLDIKKEKEGIILLKDKILNYLLNFELLEIKQEREDLGNMIKFKLTSQNKSIKFKLFYIKKYDGNYYVPIFKMDIFVDRFKVDNFALVGFLNNIFECFDGLNELEYLIDIDKSLFYTNGILNKVYPIYNFTDIDFIQEEFEENKGNKILEKFLKKYKNGKMHNEEYYKIHSIVLYYIYLVYIMYQNVIDSTLQIKYLEENDFGDFSNQKELIEKRLRYVNNLSIKNFKNYYDKLELFFNIFR